MLVLGNALRIPIADGSVQCCVTSPPYWGLRDYGTAQWQGGDEDCDHGVKYGPQNNAKREARNEIRDDADGVYAHPAGWQGSSRSVAGTAIGNRCGKCGAKRIDNQLGLEPTPDEFVASMVAVFREVYRVLRSDGTLFLNMGDSFGEGKQLQGMPWKVAFALQADGWILRSDCIWAKPNPMPESVTDRPTKSHEYVFMLTKSASYYWDAEAVREGAEYGRRNWKDEHFKNGDIRIHHKGTTTGADPDSGRNIRTVWTIPTESYPGSHFATFPRKLVEPCVKAGTSQKGCCPECGKGWVREVESSGSPDGGFIRKPGTDLNGAHRTRPKANSQQMRDWKTLNPDRHLGWRPQCQHGHAPVPCTVFDPFTGSGTTGVVAEGLHRRFIGIDLSRQYLKLANRRINRPHAPIPRPGRIEHHPLFDRIEEEPKQEMTTPGTEKTPDYYVALNKENPHITNGLGSHPNAKRFKNSMQLGIRCSKETTPK